MSVEIDTACRHCDKSLRIRIDSSMRVSVREAEAAPLVFMPDVDWAHFAERTIVHAY